ncbi:hypothetical protein C3L33_07247, partial [Rhododendron williamsianum]
MVKTGVFDGDPTMITKASELKKELQRLVRAIVDNDDSNAETIDRATQTLRALKEVKSKTRVSLRKPSHDGGLLSCVQRSFGALFPTYDRPFIQRWLKSGHRTCPQLNKSRSRPFHFFARENVLDSVEQKEAARELRLLTKRMPSFRALFSESIDAIPQLLNPLSQNRSQIDLHPELQEDLITTLLNLSIHDNNKKFVAETPMVISLVIDALRSGTVETRSNAAATLFTLSALDSNKALIGKSGALKSLIDLLEEGHPLAMKDVASAVFNLCIIQENKASAVRDGAVGVILKKIANRIHVDELLAILAILSSNPKAVEEMGELGGVPCLLSVIRESLCPRNKENCIAILHTICFNDRTKWKEMREEEATYGTISQLAQNGTSRAKRKASGILERLNRVVNLTRTA